jgi:hypothetical protein
VGKVRTQQGEFLSAKESFGEALALLRPLAEQDVQNNALQTNLMLVLARHGDHVEATQKAEAMRTRGPQIYGNLFNIACCYSLCLNAVIQGKQSDELTMQERVWQQNYGDQAIAALLQAAARGLKGTGGVVNDRDLDAIRSHPDYPKLLEELKKTAP